MTSEVQKSVTSRDQVREVIPAVVVHVCRDRLGSRIRSLVLTGSLARGEETLLGTAKGWTLLGDGDFLAVSDHRGVTDEDCAGVCRESELSLAQQGIVAHIGIGLVRSHYFGRLRPSIFAYELRQFGRVVTGDDRILCAIPAFAAGKIPLADAYRLLGNRMIEQLEALVLPASPPGKLPDEAQYAIAKLYLDTATSLLVFVGAYHEHGAIGVAHNLLGVRPKEVGAHRWAMRSDDDEISSPTFRFR